MLASTSATKDNVTLPQGEDVVDVDIPTEAEGRIFRGIFMKVLFLFLTPAFYSLRPLFVRPKKPTAWEGINFATQLSFDFLVFYFLGGKSLFYLVIGTLLGKDRSSEDLHTQGSSSGAERMIQDCDAESLTRGCGPFRRCLLCQLSRYGRPPNGWTLRR